MSNKYDVIIVGAGPAGLFTAYELIEKKVLISINDSSLESVAKIKYLFSDDNKLISLKAEYEDLKL